MQIITDYEYETHRRAGITHLKVMSMRDGKSCVFCEHADGDVYTLDYAYNNQILPHNDCQNSKCRCYFMPEKMGNPNPFL